MANVIDTDAKVITGDELGFLHPTIVRDNSGNLYAGHINDSGYLEIHKSTDSGANWTNIKTFTHTSLLDFTMTINTSSGLLFVGYTKLEYRYLYKCVLSTNTWTALFEDIYQQYGYRMIIIYANGRLWYFHDISVGVGYDKIYFNSSLDNGSTWATLQTYGGGIKAIRTVDYDPTTNKISLMNVRDKSGVLITKLMVFRNNDGNAESATTIYTSLTSSDILQDIDIAIDSFGNRWTSYHYTTDTGTKHQVKVFKNGVPNLDIFVDELSNPVVTGSVSIGIDSNDNVFVFYTKSSDGSLHYRRYSQSIATWGSEIAFESTPNNRVSCEKHSLTTIHMVYYYT